MTAVLLRAPGLMALVMTTAIVSSTGCAPQMSPPPGPLRRIAVLPPTSATGGALSGARPGTESYDASSQSLSDLLAVPSKNSCAAIFLRFCGVIDYWPVMMRWLGIVLGTGWSAVRTHRELALENLALRQQVAVWKARQPRPRLTAMDRMFWVLLSRLWTSWRQSLQLVRPETVVSWHRQGFRRYWAWKSRRRSGRLAIHAGVRDLIRRMRYANPLWVRQGSTVSC